MTAVSTPEATPTRAIDRTAGAVAAAVALGLTEIASGLAPSVPRLVPAVADRIVDVVPGDIVRRTISAFGTAQKPLLVTGILIVTLIVGAWVGGRARRQPRLADAAFAGFGLVGVWAGAGAVGATITGAVVAAAVGAGGGRVALATLLAVSDGRLGAMWRRFTTTGSWHPDPIAPSVDSPIDPRASRRRFLGAAGVAVLGATAATAGGAVLRGRSSVAEARRELVLPAPVEPAPPLPAGITGIEGHTPLITPNDRFYRIDTAIVLPQVDPARWSLTVDGLVDTPIELSFDELLAMPLVEGDVTLSCVSNEVGGDLVGTARWLGVPLTDLLDRAGVRRGAEQVVGHSVDGFTAGFPIDVLADGRPALVAVAMNGEPLPVRHGFPARLVVSGLYGYVSATKWLSRIELTTWDGFDGYWIDKGWAKDGPVKTQSRIDVPRRAQRLVAGPVPVAGVAWAPSRGIELVEVQVDEGPWIDAELSEPIGAHAWRQWLVRWDATPGRHRLRVRATDATGATQDVRTRPVAPDGATGWHTVLVEVEPA